MYQPSPGSCSLLLATSSQYARGFWIHTALGSVTTAVVGWVVSVVQPVTMLAMNEAITASERIRFSISVRC